MQMPPTHIAPGDLSRWRRAPDRSESPIAIVCGHFGLLHPGNLEAILEAARRASEVLVLLAPDDERPEHGETTAERATMVAHLRGVSASTSLAGDPASDPVALQPYVLVTAQDDDTPPTLYDAAAEVVTVPVAPGCRSAQIRQVIAHGPTPVSVDIETPADLYHPPRPKPGTVATINGCFDVIHCGHLEFLARAAEHADHLVVLINDDESVRRYKGETRPVFPIAFRCRLLGSLKSVSAVGAFAEDEPLDALGRLRPDVHIKGGTYEEARIAHERDLVESWGGRIEFVSMIGEYSSTRAIEREAKRADTDRP